MSDVAPSIATERSALDRMLMNGMAWTAALRFASQGVSLVGVSIAARILTPGDYGLIGMAMLAIGLVRMVEDVGMDTVLVQDRTIDADQQSRLAGFIILLGVLFALSFVALATPIAAFFKEPQVALLVSALGTWCIADALQVIPKATLQRELEFRKLAIAQFVQTLVAQSVLVTGALLGWGVWALVCNSLTAAFAVTALFIYWRPFAVSWPRRLRELARPLLQGWRILASRFAWYAYTSADQTIVGRFLGKDALGIYGQAQGLSTAISQEISAVVSRVVPGVFSTVQQRTDELRRYFALLTELLCLLVFPVLIGTAAVADLLVALLLGPQWDGVVVPLRLLCVYGAFYSAQVLVGHLLLWTGRFRANMWCSILAVLIMPPAFYIGSRWGLPGVAWAWVIAYPLANLPGFVIAFRIVRINGWNWLAMIRAPLVASALMAVGVFAVRKMGIGEGQVVELIVAVACGAALYVSILWLLFRERMLAMFEFMKTIRSAESTATSH